jgi:hypothetical protein
MTRTILHIGAHKTATTYLQNRLALNGARISAAGIRYESLDKIRGQLNFQKRKGAFEHNAYLADLRDTVKTRDLLLSEENLLGFPTDIIKNDCYYLQAGNRVSGFLSAIDAQEVELFLSLRDYASFTVSMYCELIRARAFISFADYFELYRRSGFSWVKLIDDLVAAAPKAKITIWDYADFRRLEEAILTAMLGFDAQDLARPDGGRRESFSTMAIRAYDALSAVMSPEELKMVMKPIARTFSKAEGYEAFDPHSAEVKATLSAAYRDDLARIAARHTSIRILS